MLAALSETGTPLLYIPAVGNLHEAPFGVDDEPQKQFRAGINETDYNRRMYHLLKASDGSVMNKLVKTKIPLLEMAYDIEAPNLYVFDLEYELLRSGFEFDYDAFLDEGHFKVATHKYFSEFMADYIIRERFCCGIEDGG